VAGHQTIVDLGQPHMDADHVGNRATPISAARSRQAFVAVLAQTGNQFATQLTARLSIDGVVNRFVRPV